MNTTIARRRRCVRYYNPTTLVRSLMLMDDYHTDAEIATRFGISVNSVRNIKRRRRVGINIARRVAAFFTDQPIQKLFVLQK